MKTDKGTLNKAKKGFRVSLPSKKGSAEHQVPDAATYFDTSKVEDGTEVEVTRDSANRIIKVVVPGQKEMPPRPPEQKGGHGGQGSKSGNYSTKPKHFQKRGGGGPSQPPAIRNLKKAPASVLGGKFYNPYTFLPFGDGGKRTPPSPLTIDEQKDEADRYTGVLTLEVITKSPLLSCSPTPEGEKTGDKSRRGDKHQTYEVLAIGEDVIVPATGVRGALRTLMTTITGGTLGYLNEGTYLVQGRDTNLGPRGPSSPEHTPANVFLAEVVEPGTSAHPGRIRLGSTQLMKLQALERCKGGRNLDRKPGADYWVRLDETDSPVEISKGKNNRTDWRLKLSGRPINLKGKREGAFRPTEHTIDLPIEYWVAYSGRNAFGDRPELRAGDLVWLEPKNPDATRITSADDIKSIQWSRWGKRGQSLKSQIPPEMRPDYLRGDKLVDEVTNLFGQLDPITEGAVEAFAARIRPENLVFFNAKSRVSRETLAPLAPPHPGCMAFYRDNDNPDEVSDEQLVRGYKVYRNTNERGDQAPWLYKNQGVYGDQGELKPKQQKVNKTCDLLDEGVVGTLRISFRALSMRELSLLLLSCSVPWRLGGGKPLGLGHCTAKITDLIGEDGEVLKVGDWNIKSQNGEMQIEGWESSVEELQRRVEMWEASQQPVDKLRYPRAVDENRNKKSRGGHSWFMRHAKPRMVTQKDGERESGLEPIYIDGKVKEKAQASGAELDDRVPMVAGQVLPLFSPENPAADALFGYDLIGSKTRDEQRPRKRVFLEVEPFDPTKHITKNEKSGGNQGKNKGFRDDQKNRTEKDSDDNDKSNDGKRKDK